MVAPLISLPIPESLKRLCERLKLIPLTISENQFVIASDAPLTHQQEQALRFAVNKPIETIIWSKVKFNQHIEAMKKNVNSLRYLTTTTSNQLNEISAKYEGIAKDDNKIIKLANQILFNAIEQRASDIHFEPYPEHYRVRFRIDGVLKTMLLLPQILANPMAARLKILAKLDIAERRLPQDGQLTFHCQQQTYLFRINSLPIIDGEKIALRLVESQALAFNLETLGMSEELSTHYYHALQQPQGLILVTGPTGSGKTVTLYTGIKQINHEQRHICSVEDPIEMPLEGVNQVQVNPKIELTFTKALRAFLRQDPDVIMVGEIRDKETAQITINAAQTGHLVLSTLHTNSTVESLLRLQQMGIEPYLTLTALKLIIAQRLVRRLCDHCKERITKTKIVVTLPYWQEKISHWQAKGCQHCISGYYGRIAVYEYLTLTAVMKQALLQPMTVTQLEDLAISQGMQPLFIMGLKLVQAGMTSLVEIYRALGQDKVVGLAHAINIISI